MSLLSGHTDHTPRVPQEEDWFYILKILVDMLTCSQIPITVNPTRFLISEGQELGLRVAGAAQQQGLVPGLALPEVPQELWSSSLEARGSRGGQAAVGEGVGRWVSSPRRSRLSLAESVSLLLV